MSYVDQSRDLLNSFSRYTYFSSHALQVPWTIMNSPALQSVQYVLHPRLVISTPTSSRLCFVSSQLAFNVMAVQPELAMYYYLRNNIPSIFPDYHSRTFQGIFQDHTMFSHSQVSVYIQFWISMRLSICNHFFDSVPNICINEPTERQAGKNSFNIFCLHQRFFSNLIIQMMSCEAHLNIYKELNNLVRLVHLFFNESKF